MSVARSSLALIGGAALGIVACSKQPPVRAAHGTDHVEGVDCAAVKPPVEPDLIAWDPSSRVQLDKLRREGVVAVRYEAHGCDVSLELLPRCIGPKNRYVYSPYSATDTKIARDASELFAKLPLGAANVSSLLDGRRALRADTKLVGTVGLPAGSTITEYDLVGPECKRATHVIGALYVGGFAMAAADARRVSSTDLFTAPPTEGMTREGQAQICERAVTEGIELPGCSVPLRVSLIPIGGGAASPAEPTGVAPAGAAPAGAAPAGAAPAGAAHAGAAPAGVKECPAKTTFDGKRCAPDDGAGEDASGEPRVFDQSAVERLVREKQGGVRRKCWETASDSVRRVNVTVTTTVDPQGRVAKAEPQLVDADGSTDVAQMVARCISSEIQSWRFPEPEKQTVLTFPFHFIRQQ